MSDALTNDDAERTVLACILAERDCLYTVLPLLQAKDFGLDSHRKIYAAVQELADKGLQVDCVTLTEALIGKGQLDAIGGVGYLAGLSEKIDAGLARVTNVEHYAEMVRDKSRRRRVHIAARNLISRTEDASLTTAECLAGIQESLLSIEAAAAGKSSARHVKDVLKETLATLEKQSAAQGLVGMPTGLHSLDVSTGGIPEGELWTIGALPGKGKSALAVQMLIASAQSGFPSCAFSLEMQEIEIGKRLLAAQSAVSSTHLRNPQRIDRGGWSALLSTAADLAELPIWIDDSPSLTVSQLLAKARLYIRRHKTKLILVDYLRLVEAPGRELRERVGFVANAMRQLAKAEQVGVVLLSQLRRPQGSVNEKPTMLDLKESGDVEAHSHVVLLPYLPTDDDGAPKPEEQLLIIGKNRNGSTGWLPVYFDKNRLQFMERTDR